MVYDVEFGAVASAVLLVGTLLGRLWKGREEHTILKYKVWTEIPKQIRDVEADLNGLGNKQRADLAAVEMRLRGELGRIQLRMGKS